MALPMLGCMFYTWAENLGIGFVIVMRNRAVNARDA